MPTCTTIIGRRKGKGNDLRTSQAQREKTRVESVLIGGAEESGAKQKKWPFCQINLVFSVAFGLVVDVADTLCIH